MILLHPHPDPRLLSICTTGAESTLIVRNISADNLGIYQCVAERKSSVQSHSGRPEALAAFEGDREWVAASALLALESDRVIRSGICPRDAHLLMIRKTAKQVFVLVS